MLSPLHIGAALQSDDGFVCLYNEAVSASQRSDIMRFLVGLVIWKREMALKKDGTSLEAWAMELESRGLASRRTIFNYKAFTKSATLALFASGRFFNDLRIDAQDADEPDAAWFKQQLLPAIDLSIFDDPSQVERLAAAHKETQMELALKGGSKRPQVFKVDRRHLAKWIECFAGKYSGKPWEQLPKRLQDEYRATGHKWDPRTPDERRDASRASLKALAFRLVDDFDRQVLQAGDVANLELADWREIHDLLDQVHARTRKLAAGKEAL
jgi:hypothetical protein